MTDDRDKLAATLHDASATITIAESQDLADDLLQSVWLEGRDRAVAHRVATEIRAEIVNEYLIDATGHKDDLMYDHAISDAIDALDRWLARNYGGGT